MAWVYLFLAGFFETCWAVGMKLSHGFSRPGWVLFTAVTMALSVWLLALAMRALPMGSSYAIWTGIGAVGTAVLGIILFKEPAEFWRMLSIFCILAGLIGLYKFHKAFGLQFFSLFHFILTCNEERKEGNQNDI